MRRSISLSLFIIFIIGIFSTCHAQRVITGKIVDESDNPLIGASVLIKGTSIGTVTDIDGTFSIESPTDSVTLWVNYTGFSGKEVSVDKSNKVTVRLDEGLALSEVVVTGYATKRRKAARASGISYSHDSRVEMSSAAPPKAIHCFPTDEGMDATYEATEAKAGMLTAGELNDFSKWELWQDIAKEDLEEWQRHWQFRPLERYTVQATTQKGYPLVDAEVQLLDKNGTPVSIARTDNTGKAELWANLHAQPNQPIQKYQIVLLYEGKRYPLKQVTNFQDGINSIKIPVACAIPNNLDIMMVVDATGSMGDEIAYLKSELRDVIQKVQKTHTDLNINLGSVFYRDKGDEYLTRKSDFSTNIEKTLTFIKEQSANGGGDTPEAVENALSEALETMKWSDNAVARLLFLVLDAPPHHNEAIVKKIHQLSAKAATLGIKIIPITGSGIDKSTEYLMRCLSLTSNGTYVFLTDHSGIGNPHIEPTTDNYKVELLNDLMIRLISQYAQVFSCESEVALLQNTPKDTITEVNINVFPNPTAGLLNIDLEENIPEIFLTDASGKVLERYQKWKKGRQQLDLIQYPSGIYFLQFKTKNKIWNKKIILNHRVIIAGN